MCVCLRSYPGGAGRLLSGRSAEATQNTALCLEAQERAAGFQGEERSARACSGEHRCCLPITCSRKKRAQTCPAVAEGRAGLAGQELGTTWKVWVALFLLNLTAAKGVRHPHAAPLPPGGMKAAENTQAHHSDKKETDAPGGNPQPLDSFSLNVCERNSGGCSVCSRRRCGGCSCESLFTPGRPWSYAMVLGVFAWPRPASEPKSAPG